MLARLKCPKLVDGKPNKCAFVNPDRIYLFKDVLYEFKHGELGPMAGKDIPEDAFLISCPSAPPLEGEYYSLVIKPARDRRMGLGAFATTPIAAARAIGIYDAPMHISKEADMIDPKGEWTFGLARGPDKPMSPVLIGDAGTKVAYVNHGDKMANSKFLPVFKGCYHHDYGHIMLVSTKKIAAGEELRARK